MEYQIFNLNFNNVILDVIAIPQEDFVIAGMPYKFEIVINDEFKGMITYSNDKWIGAKEIEDELASAIGNYLVSWYEFSAINEK